jgi:6-pyruvoyltetrahydropterin/6-carboxytetrahydropterin synthase
MQATKVFTFDSAHQLRDYVGQCANLHGHTYILHVTVNGPVQKNGLIIDFSTIKKVVKKLILDKLDHKYLNDIINQPSAENITLWIWKQLENKLPLYEIKLWETPTSFVTYRGENA